MASPPSTARLRFGFALVGLARRWRRALDERMGALGLSDAAWPPLVHLDRLGDGISQNELAARCGIDGSSLVRLLDLLGERGLIERRISPSDRRSRLVFLTTNGRRMLRSVYRVLQEAESEMLQDIDDTRLQATLDMFARIEQRLGEGDDQE
ncbi:Regulatory protein, MarR [Bradyrhizobium sp. ORS 285]|uniref:MarR family winged helix-turn-helix transcriptional regulator n=1 Tax=Bradyrhizobium sp. ORS 285 TaxID=115808 RepID=UPI0002409504|nr:MarR family transcriptional regulator [Bradyrhizobium sp. ORS 285]CCD87505.1 Regulatory protein, MarR [Bradyrhizobium sp. ORS 285]SMX60342.1 Regulatory protein, MarR [Bradyrhizobium sp. ORS 285]